MNKLLLFLLCLALLGAGVYLLTQGWIGAGVGMLFASVMATLRTIDLLGDKV